MRTLTVRKVFNIAALYFSYQLSRVLRKPVHRGNPAKLGVEPTTSCNLRCPECPSGLRSFTRPTGMLRSQVYEPLIDELAPDLVYLLMYFQGEPYLNPAFLDMAAYAVKKNIYVGTSTNAHYLDDVLARRTVESGIHEVIVSIDGATQETYKQYRVGGNLEKVKEGVRNLVKWRDELRSRTPHIILQFLVVQPNEHEIPAIEKLGAELGVDKVAFKTAQIYDFRNGSPLIPSQEKYSRYVKKPDGTWRIKSKLKNQCWKMWQGAEVTWDGKVLPCCFDKDAKYVMGETGKLPFKTIWHNEEYRTFRAGLLRSRESVDICTNCSEGLKVWSDA